MWRRARAALQALPEGFAGLWRRLRHNWRLKLGALLLAVVLWLFISMDDTVIGQRTLRAPLKVEGLGSQQVVSGVPDAVEVRLSGPAHRVGALNPSGVDAVLDLRGVTGAFEQTVRVFPPQGINLISVRPSEIWGSVETLVEQPVPVEVALVGEPPDDVQLEARALPSAVVVSGPESQVAQVARVLAPLRPGGAVSTVPVYAVDEAGLPVPEVQVQPAEVELSVDAAPVLYTRRVPVVLRPLSLPSLEVRSATLSQPEALLAGSEAELAALERVRATAVVPQDVGPGQHTLEVALELPEGVTALELPRLEVALAAKAPSGPPPERAP
ncbi:YbbR family protein [Truepera radiovictrix DSM 17093]|uniref:YbbR family protein n=1 Tax=Truepera radiovictrix (strain DSM 17093 / CIP 108686 / LMG 22925 / RQ-24) TaxID=649638 RepID=D7CQ37_TRURR|nr:YbbR family protein [Truepera radiovictrix DSM 17093]